MSNDREFYKDRELLAAQAAQVASENDQVGFFWCFSSTIRSSFIRAACAGMESDTYPGIMVRRGANRLWYAVFRMLADCGTGMTKEDIRKLLSHLSVEVNDGQLRYSAVPTSGKPDDERCTICGSPVKKYESDEGTHYMVADRSEEMEFRRLLWANHGCPVTALYGDDGEMQCHVCRIDFKRMSPEDIKRRFVEICNRELESQT